MKASFELSRVDFRTTPVENIFLDTYLSHAPQEALRVYLAGWKACYSHPDEHVENSDLADFLGLSTQEVDDAVQYWVNEGLVVVDDDHPGQLIFRSMLLLWAGIDEPHSSVNQAASSRETATTKTSRLTSGDLPREEKHAVGERDATTAGPPRKRKEGGLSQAEMFDALEDFLSEGLRYRVTLKENELRLILQVMEHYAFAPAYFLYAYQSACRRNEVGSRSVNYVVAVIENWARFEQITTREALDAYFAKADQEKAVRPGKRKRKQAAFAEKDTRMSRAERKEWVNRKLEESRKRSLRGDSTPDAASMPGKENAGDGRQTGGKA